MHPLRLWTVRPLPAPFPVAGFALVVPVATWSYSIVYGRAGERLSSARALVVPGSRRAGCTGARTPSMRGLGTGFRRNPAFAHPPAVSRSSHSAAEPGGTDVLPTCAARA